MKYIEEEEEQSRGGIIIPDSAKEKPQEAEVIALGTGKKDDKGKVQDFEVKVGDRVLISKYGGTEVKLDDEKSLEVLRAVHANTLGDGQKFARAALIALGCWRLSSPMIRPRSSTARWP